MMVRFSHLPRLPPLLRGEERASCPVELAWCSPVEPTANRGFLATGRVSLPSTDRVEVAAGRITTSDGETTSADRGASAAGRVTRASTDRGEAAAGRVELAPAD